MIHFSRMACLNRDHSFYCAHPIMLMGAVNFLSLRETGFFTVFLLMRQSELDTCSLCFKSFNLNADSFSYGNASLFIRMSWRRCLGSRRSGLLSLQPATDKWKKTDGWRDEILYTTSKLMAVHRFFFFFFTFFSSDLMVTQGPPNY